jgi:putative hydrolase of the HAD superfamily
MFNGVDVHSEKNVDAYRAVLRRRHIEPKEFVMVGNSLRSDVVPVVEMGARAVHIPYVMTWHLEHVDDAALPRGGWYRLAAIAELSALLDSLDQASALGA